MPQGNASLLSRMSSIVEPVDLPLVFAVFLLNIITKGSIACYETLGVALSMKRYQMDSETVGFVFSVFGFLGVLSLLSFRTLCRYFNDVQLVLQGVVLMILSSILIQFEYRYVFFISIFTVYSIGYPVGHTAVGIAYSVWNHVWCVLQVIGLFSKVLGKRPQGELLGYFGSAGSLARIFFPILAGVVSDFCKSTIEKSNYANFNLCSWH